MKIGVLPRYMSKSASEIRLVMLCHELIGEIRQVFAETPGEFDPRKYLGPAREAIKDMVKHKLQVLGCAGKAAECK